MPKSLMKKSEPSYTRSNLIKLVITFVITVLVMVADLASIVQWWGIKNKPGDSDIRNQLGELDKVTNSLNNLLTFVEKQKERLVIEEKIIKQLSAEKEKLEPIVKADRETIERLFDLQEERLKSRRWIDTGVGFILGILSSMIASLILGIVRKRKNISVELDD